MSNPRFPGRDRDLSLERLGDRDGLRPAPLGEIGHHSSAHAPAARETLADREARVDAAFLAAGAAEWLHALGVAVAALLARQASPPREDPMREAIRTDMGPRPA